MIWMKRITEISVSDSDVLVRDVSGPGLKTDGPVPEYSILWDLSLIHI